MSDDANVLNAGSLFDESGQVSLVHDVDLYRRFAAPPLVVLVARDVIGHVTTGLTMRVCVGKGVVLVVVLVAGGVRQVPADR